jgi:hypothetical protein
MFRSSDFVIEEIRQHQKATLPHPLEDIAGYEQTLICALQSGIRVGDRMTVVGGGEGVTAVVATQAVGETGSVVCFEGGG